MSLRDQVIPARFLLTLGHFIAVCLVSYTKVRRARARVTLESRKREQSQGTCRQNEALRKTLESVPSLQLWLPAAPRSTISTRCSTARRLRRRTGPFGKWRCGLAAPRPNRRPATTDTRAPLQQTTTGGSEPGDRVLRPRLFGHVQRLEHLHEQGRNKEGRTVVGCLLWTVRGAHRGAHRFTKVNLLQIIMHFIGGVLIASFVSDSWRYSNLW